MALKYPAALLFALLLAGSAVGQTSPFNYVSFDFPGAMHTQGKGINASGEIVGLYTNDPNCFLSAWPATDCQTHGFKRVNGKYSTIDVPGALSTAALGVNAYGDIVGFYIKSDNTVHGFLWLHTTNTFRTLDYPGTGTSTTALVTIPMGVNTSLTVVGGLYSTFATFNGGWVWKNGTFANMFLGTADCYRCTSVNGVANSGKIAGHAVRNGLLTGFLKIGPDEDFFTKTLNTLITGLNNNADIVGWGNGGGFFAADVELNETSEGAEVIPDYIPVGFPTSVGSTFPFGVNYLRIIVGTYEDDNNGWHGFTATPNF